MLIEHLAKEVKFKVSSIIIYNVLYLNMQLDYIKIHVV